ncbi:MAG: PAS domain S-box protein [Verrucomicrobia bacterium]|nr:PAS domain S-box protein [Verrucomicrobiota bacterium]
MPDSNKPKLDTKLLQSLIENVTDYAVALLDAQGRITSCNAGARQLHRCRDDELVGHHFSRFHSDEDKAAGKAESLLDQARSTGRAAGEAWRQRADGSRFWASFLITPLRNEAGEVAGFGEIVCDLSDHKLREEKLRAGAEQFRMLVDSVDEYAIYMLDADGYVTTWNSGAQQMKGYSAADIIGKNFSCFYTPEEKAAGKPQYNLGYARQHGACHDRGLRVRKDGSTFHADVLITALRDKTGAIRGYSKVTRDVTDQIRTREIEAARIAAEKANKAKDQFLAALSHELRTPLTPALAAAGFLAERASSIAPEYIEELEIIRRNIQLEARLIDDLLDVTRITRGMLQLQRTRVDAHLVVQNALDVAAAAINEKALLVMTDFAAGEHHLWADPVRLQQVFWNLINNAVKFTGEGGSIKISTQTVDGWWQFAIADTGIGVEPDRQGALFRAFEQAGPAARNFGGLGLGLAISKNLVELHGGKIAMESAGKDQGSVFTVTMPIARFEEPHPAESSRSRNARAKALRILLVEDHGDTRRTLSSLLRHFGHTISIADCVQAALDAVKSEEFDAVLSDIGLPDGTGYDIIARAKKKQSLKGVALTGFGMEEDVRRSQEAGFDYHLTKPIDFAELRKVLAELSAKKT